MVDFIHQVDNSWTLFLDRDGVINRRIFGGYVTKTTDFEFLPDVLPSLNIFARRFGRICVVTNQQGIGKGLMSENQVKALHQFMIEQVQQSGGRIDKVYYCPDLATVPNNCRKPNIHMANLAKADFPEINFSKSIMVGDSLSDMEFGRNAGMHVIYVKHGSEIKKNLYEGSISGLSELAGWIQQVRKL